VTADLIAWARAGDGEAFRQLIDPYQRELQVHCYRILGSVQDAEDALQETLLAAWRGLSGFEGRASIRTWLYQVATSSCLKALRSASRRPQADWPLPGIDLPEPTRLGEISWLEPYPDVLLEGLADSAPGPEARYEATEAISLAFITALQLLPPRQRAVLILRDVLGFHAREAAQMLDSSQESVTSALKRARATLQHWLPPPGKQELPPAPNSAPEQELITRLTRAYQKATWTPSSPCSPTTSGWPCRRLRWNTTAVSSQPGSCKQPLSGRAAPSGWSRPEPTTSPLTASTSRTRVPASPTPAGCSSSPSPAARSAQ
jgi:RNA polymerase sigma-70 factor (TIGR02960 family)